MGALVINPIPGNSQQRWLPDQAVFDLGLVHDFKEAAQKIGVMREAVGQAVDRLEDGEELTQFSGIGIHDAAIGTLAGMAVGAVGGFDEIDRCFNHPPSFWQCAVLTAGPYLVGGAVVGGLAGQYVGGHQLATTDRSIKRDVEIGAAAGATVGALLGVKHLPRVFADTYAGPGTFRVFAAVSAATTLIATAAGAVAGSFTGLATRLVHMHTSSKD